MRLDLGSPEILSEITPAGDNSEYFFLSSNVEIRESHVLGRVVYVTPGTHAYFYVDTDVDAVFEDFVSMPRSELEDWGLEPGLDNWVNYVTYVGEYHALRMFY